MEFGVVIPSQGLFGDPGAIRAFIAAAEDLDYHTAWFGDHIIVQAPPPLQQPFPLLVGGNSDRALERAALHGTGWHPLFPTPQKYRAGRDTILEHRRRAGITEPFHFAMSCPGTQVVLESDPPSAPADLSGYRDVPDEYGYAPPFPTTPDGRAMFVGNPDQLAADVRAYAEAGVEHLALRFWTVDPGATVDGVIAQMERWQQHVAPAVR